MGEGLGGGMLGVTLIGNGRNRPEADSRPANGGPLYAPTRSPLSKSVMDEIGEKQRSISDHL